MRHTNEIYNDRIVTPIILPPILFRIVWKINLEMNFIILPISACFWANALPGEWNGWHFGRWHGYHICALEWNDHRISLSAHAVIGIVWGLITWIISFPIHSRCMVNLDMLCISGGLFSFTFQVNATRICRVNATSITTCEQKHHEQELHAGVIQIYTFLR